MNQLEYIKNVTRTENTINVIDTHKNALCITLEAIIAAGNILDQIKKNIFYGKQIDEKTYKSNVCNLIAATSKLDTNPQIYTLNSEEIKIDTRLFHGIVGNITETVELTEALLDNIKTGETDVVNIAEELGDSFFYQAIIMDTLNLDQNQILERNVAKLKARFPEKFTTDNAINRDVEKERKILEGN